MTPTSTAAARVSGTIKALTSEDREKIIEAAYVAYRRYNRGARGQLITEWDGIESHVVVATERYILAAIQPDPEPKPVVWFCGGCGETDPAKLCLGCPHEMPRATPSSAGSLNIGNADSHSPSSAGMVSVEAAAKVLMAAQEAYFDGEGGSDALGSLDTEALRALAGEGGR